MSEKIITFNKKALGDRLKKTSSNIVTGAKNKLNERTQVVSQRMKSGKGKVMEKVADKGCEVVEKQKKFFDNLRK